MSNIRSSRINIRVNPEIKEKAEPILSAIGLSFSDAVNLLLNQICLKRKIPFDLSSVELTENGYTPEFEAEVLKESEELYAAVANGTIKPYNSVAEMVAEWAKEDAEDDE